MLEVAANRRKMLKLSSAGIYASLACAWRGAAAPFQAGAGPRSYPQAVAASGPLAYWRLDELRGPTARDATGRGNDARCFGRLLFGQRGAIAVEPGRAVGLNEQGSVSYLEVRDRDHFSVAASGKGLTVEVWMRHGPAPVRLGTRDLRSFFTGGLDEVAIYPRVLGADEVLLHWRASRGQ